MEEPKWRGIAKISMHVAICYSRILAVAIVAHKIGRPELANNIAASHTKKPKTSPKHKNKPKTNFSAHKRVQGA